MHLIIQAPFDTPRHVQGQMPPGKTLGNLCGDYQQHVTGCQVNGIFLDDWATYQPANDDTVTLFAATQAAGIVPILITVLISTALSIALAQIIKALTPTPSNTAGKTEQVFGIAGLTNTTALGTPLFLVYGNRRVFGHIINTQVTIAPDGKSTAFRILYFMGEGPIAAITDPEINETPINQFPGVSWEARLGDGNTVPIPGFDSASSVWSDGRTLDLGTPLVYTTRGGSVFRVTLIFATPFLFDQDARGNRLTSSHELMIEAALVSDGIYSEVANSPLEWIDNAESTRFLPFTIELGAEDAWLIRITLTATSNMSDTPPTLYNVQEDSPGGTTYPTSALLSFSGIASNQVQSFEQMRGSGLVQGRIVHKPVIVAGVWDGSTYEDVWSPNRAWIIRDLLTNQTIGLGHRLDSSLFDDAAAVTAANYWDAVAFGSMSRDRCDILINERKPAWDWINTILTEGQALLLPSDGKLKLIADQADTPGLLYSVPGNILEGTVERTAGDGSGQLRNAIIGQFADEEQNYRLQPLEVKAAGTESDPTDAQLVTLYTITHTARAFWLLRSQLLRSRLVQRHFRWQSPESALVSEPLDKVSLSYATPNFARGISGFCPSGSTTTRLLLDKPVTLAAATTYDLIVRHHADNSVEHKTVSTAAGTWGALAPTVAFTTAPAEGDLWALGVEDTALLPVTIESVSVEEDHYVVTASEYRAEVYETPEPPNSPGVTDSTNRRPLLLFDASASQINRMGDDGSITADLRFTVTPQMFVHGGFVGADTGEVDEIALDRVLEPYLPTVRPGAGGYTGLLDEYYVGATLTFLAGTGAGQSRVIAASTNVWDGTNPPLTLVYPETDFDTAPDLTTEYQLSWPPRAETIGFKVEQSPIPAIFIVENFRWTELARFQGLTGIVPADVGSTYDTAFRFTALGPNEVEAATAGGLGKIIVYLTITGDGEAPAAPSEAEEDGGE